MIKITETIKKIKNVMDIYGWKQKDMAERSGFSEVDISRWVNGIRNPKISDVEKLVETLGMEIRLYKKE